MKKNICKMAASLSQPNKVNRNTTWNYKIDYHSKIKLKVSNKNCKQLIPNEVQSHIGANFYQCKITLLYTTNVVIKYILQIIVYFLM